MMAILQEIVEILVSGITSIASGIGTGLSELVTHTFLKTSETGDITGLSTFGGVVCVFGGISLAVGLSTFVVKWVASLGARK